MKRSLLEIYCLIVSFVFLIAIVLHLRDMLNSAYYFVQPEAGFSVEEIEYYTNLESFQERSFKFELPDGEKESPEDIENQYQRSLSLNIKQVKKGAVQNIRYHFFYFLISVFVYISHWLFALRLHARNR